MLNVTGDEPDTKKLRKSHSTVTQLAQHTSVQGALKRSLYPFAALALWAPPYLRSQRKQLHEKAPAPAYGWSRLESRSCRQKFTKLKPN